MPSRRRNIAFRRAPHALAALATMLPFVVATAAVADVVEQRGQERHPMLALDNVTVKKVNENGVTVERPDGAVSVLPLDRVRDVRITSGGEATRSSLESDWQRQKPTAIKLWRARSRVERGDTALAEPLFESLFERYADESSETALVVAEGLLRCRLARGDQARALLPALAATRARLRGVSTVSYSNLPSVWDAATSLCPQLPPVLPEGPATTAALEKLPKFTEGDDPLVREIAALYAASIVVRPDGSLAPVAPLPDPAPGVRDAPGASLLRAILATQQGDATARFAARARLDALVAKLASGAPAAGAASAGPAGSPGSTGGAAATGGTGTPGAGAASGAAGGRTVPSQPPASSGNSGGAPWASAWVSFAQGCSLLRQDGEVPALDPQRRGIVALLEVPARNERRTPWLSGTALVVAASASERLGDMAAATTLRRELDIEHPYHPLRASDGRPSSGAPGASSSGGGSGTGAVDRDAVRSAGDSSGSASASPVQHPSHVGTTP